MISKILTDPGVRETVERSLACSGRIPRPKKNSPSLVEGGGDLFDVIKRTHTLGLGTFAFLSLGGIQAGLAADPSSAATDASETVIVTGTREADKKAADSLAPIDVVTGDQLTATGQTDLRDVLSRLLPSFSRQAAAYDTGALTDAIQLRGLSPDQVLVLVNGKRRHTTANINADVGPLQGSAPVDLDLIPISAIDHIEVLRDGAAAQYGSDAIAGVVNIILKSADHGGSAGAETGAFYKGDGFTQGVSGDVGTALGPNGFLHLSGEFHYHNFSNRSGPDPQNDDIVDTRVLGDPESTREALAFNAGEKLGSGIELYLFGTYAHRDAQSWENFRNPSPDAFNSDAQALTPIYPNGFAPAETITENDFSVTAGVEGQDLLGWRWDLSSTYGGDSDRIGLVSSANSSLYVDTGSTPTSFHVGDYQNTQWTNNFDVSRPVTLGLLPAPVNVAIGLEHRRESYGLGAGDPASYYTSSNPDTSGTYGSGAQGLPGNLPAVAGGHSRNSVGTYVDLSTNLTQTWQVDVAGRYEHYSDFGSTADGKLSTRYDFSPHFAVRGTVSNGFRAPSLAEEYFSAVNVGPGYASVQVPVTSPAALALGSTPLKPEKSTNYSVGIVAEPASRLHATIDAYQIKITDRIVDSALYTDDETGYVSAALLKNGEVIPAGTTTSAQYYTNGADTLTRGLDMKADYTTDFGAWGQVRWDGALNLNYTSVRNIKLNSLGVPNLNEAGISYLSTATPRNKIVIGGTWYLDDWSVALHETRYGHVAQYDLDQVEFTNYFLNVVKAAYVTDAEIGYDVTENLHLAVGADNLFNRYPNKTNPATFAPSGWNTYDTTSPFGVNGGFYYTRLSYAF
jgi:iron complex outermembrane receptor protein